MRALLVRLLAYYFRKVQVPPSLLYLRTNRLPAIVVTLGSSVVVEGLLQALAIRAGYLTATQIHSVGASFGEMTRYSDDPSEPATLFWIDLHDERALSAIGSHPHPPLLCTFNVFQLRGPVRTPPQHRLSFTALVGLLLTRRLLFVVVGSPLTPQHGSVTRLQRQLKVDFYRNLKMVRGTPLQSIETQESIVLAGAEFERELRILSERMGQPVETMRVRAQRVFREIAANPRRPMYTVLGFLSRMIMRRLFNDVITRGLDQLSAALKDNPVVLIPMHRSHLDYIMLQYKLYESNVTPALVAAGINLSFWPVGFLTRSVGAYFVKRNARDRLHAIVLRRYVTYLIKRGHLQEFFIEGGRSRSGKMLQPKVGLLNIMLDAYRQGLRKEILFVPVSVCYETVIEDSEFGEENAGRSKKRESLLSLVRALDIFKKKYGEVIITFGPPIRTSDFVQRRLPAKEAENSIGSDFHGPKQMRTEERTTVQELGLVIVRGIRNLVNPSLSNLAYCALMGASHYGLRREELHTSITNMAALLTSLRASTSRVGTFTPALEKFLGGKTSLLGDLPRSGTVQVSRLAGEQVFYIKGTKRYTADFYRNAIIHLFVPLGIFSLLDARKVALTYQNGLAYYSLLFHDFLYKSEQDFQDDLCATRAALVTLGVLDERGETAQFTCKSIGFYNPGLLLGTIESMLWLLHQLLHNTEALQPEEADADRHIVRAFSYGRLLQSLQSDFAPARYTGLVTRTEASSKTSLEAAIDTLCARQVASLEERSGQRHRLLVKQDLSHEMSLLNESRLAAYAAQSEQLLID